MQTKPQYVLNGTACDNAKKESEKISDATRNLLIRAYIQAQHNRFN